MNDYSIDYQAAWTKIANSLGFTGIDFENTLMHTSPNALHADFYAHYVPFFYSDRLDDDCKHYLFTMKDFLRYCNLYANTNVSRSFLSKELACMADNGSELFYCNINASTGLEYIKLKSKSENFESLLVKADLAVS